MFGNNNSSKKKEIIQTGSSTTSSFSSSHALNSLVHGTKVEGTIESSNDIRVDGAIKGTLKCKAKVIIGPTGLIEGEIHAQNAVIEGRFEGALNIAEVLQIKEQARVTGEISAAKLVVQPGAVINGSFDMGGQAKNNNVNTNGNKTLKSGKETVKVAQPVK